MLRHHRSLRRIVCSLALVLFAFAFAASPGRAQSAKWDRDRVAALSGELADLANDMRRSFRREPPQAVGTGQARARAIFLDSLRVFRTETRALATALEAGAGFDDTWPIARRLRIVVRDLREEGRRISLKEPGLGQVRRAEELLTQLAPFWFDTNAPIDLPDPATTPAPAAPPAPAKK